MEKIETHKNDTERYKIALTMRNRATKATVEDIQRRIDLNRNNMKTVIVRLLQLKQVRKLKVLNVKLINIEKHVMELDIEVQKKKKDRRRERIIERDNRIEKQKRKREERYAL